MPELNLGPFSLERPIGKGAMGEVWKAQHRDTGTPVAIKVMTAAEALVESKVKSFFNEIRAVAQLDHPGIAWVLDYGTVGEDAARATEGHMLADSPYLAMEYASRGTLADITHSYNWSELRAVVLALLDGLAHAHARGVIHRDLKPANVLLCSRNDVRPGLKLCDFGIAFAMEEVRDDAVVAGTLHYMAPEQLEARAREQGPWTDLYALGCLTWKLLTGHPPFHGKRQTSLMLAQLQEDPPPLLTPTPIPEGFEEWLRTLLAKDPTERFRCAADAARGLLDLGRPEESDVDEDMMTGILKPVMLTANLPLPPPEDPQTVVPSDSATLAAEPMTLILDMPTVGHTGSALHPASVRAGMPLDWRRPARARPALDLVGAGLHLFGLRKPPFVGREAERDRLWSVLTDVHRQQRAHCVLLTGPGGVGKSRLALWVAQRAAEVGAAQVLTARFSGVDDADSALRGMLLRRFHAHGLDGDELEERLNDAMNELGIANAELRQHAQTLLSGDKLQGASRYVVIRLLLEAIALDRPTVLVLDDVHAGIDGLRFARHLINAQAVRPFPALVLLTCRPEQIEENGLQPDVDAITADKRTQVLPVDALPRESTMELVQQLLGLEPALAEQVVERTAGNPLFAIQLVGDWVEREQLTLGSRGFKLKKGVANQLPPSLKYIWVKRLARVLETTDAETEQMLEGAAVLGMEVDEIEWAGMCDDPQGLHRDQGRVVVIAENARRRYALIEKLLQLNLAEETESGFAFTHGQFRDAILDRARAHGRLKKHHHAAACQLGPDARNTELERFGRHLLGAGQREAAIDPLLRAVPAVQATVGRMSAWRLLDTIEHTLRKLDLPRSDVRWGRLYLERALLSEHLGQHRRAVKWAAKAGQEASRHNWPYIAASANFRLARASMRKGELDLAQARLVRVTNQVYPKEHPFLVGEALFLLGRIGRDLGDPPEKVAQLLKAGRTWMMRDKDPRRRATAMLHLARAALEDDQPATCAALTERARKIAIEIGDLPQQVNCLSFAAEVARTSGDLVQAAEHLRKAIEVFELIGDAQLALLRCNLAIVLLDQGLHGDALKELDRALSNAIEVDRDPLRLAVQTVRVRALAEVENYADLDEALAACEDLVARVRTGERDSARCTERAATVLKKNGERERAARALTIARDQYEKLKDDAALERLA
ncbi:MAG: protein kinase [Alphaproteobacteria bacterium]|nr:protein kinase [Alphaproteobacteria bacterium]